MKVNKLLSLLLLAGLVVSCGNPGATSTEPGQGTTPPAGETTTAPVESPYTIKISAIGSATIQVGKTVTLRTTVTGTTQKDVTWSSLSESIATVSEKGVVTGVSAGKATIRATLNIDPNCFADFTVTVEEAAKPTSLTINKDNLPTVGWVGEEVQLKVAIEPAEASNQLNYVSSDPEIASVSETGLISFLSRGEVVIEVQSKVDTSISDTVSFEVKYGTFDTTKGSQNWTFDYQDEGENSYIELSDAEDSISGGYHAAWFGHKTGKVFYAEATFKITRLTSNSWDWMGIGLGSGLSDSDARFFTYSPHSPSQTANNYNKFILRDRPESWGALTNRTQIWGEHGLQGILLEDDIKIAMLRNGNEYYYLINDEVYWQDVHDLYGNVETSPFIISYDIPVKVSKWYYTTDEAEVLAKLDTPDYKKSFYPAYDNVTYVDDSNFSFNSINTLSKDHKVRSLGDKAKLVGNFEIEFDVKDMAFNSQKSCFTGLTVNLSRYDNADVVDTMAIGRSAIQNNDNAIIGRFVKWSYPQSMESSGAIQDYYETEATVKDDAAEKSHVVIRREIDYDKERANFYLTVDGVNYEFPIDIKDRATTTPYSTYMGAYIIWVAGEYSSSSIENFVFRSNI